MVKLIAFLIALCVGALGAPFGALAQSCTALSSKTSQALLAGVNAERAAKRRAPLVLSSALGRAAQGHACDMLRRDYFSHKAPGGGTMSKRIKATGYIACRASENIAMGQKFVASALSGWMGSSGHRRNILDKRILEVGFGMIGTGRDRRWVMVGGKRC